EPGCINNRALGSTSGNHRLPASDTSPWWASRGEGSVRFIDTRGGYMEACGAPSPAEEGDPGGDTDIERLDLLRHRDRCGPGRCPNDRREINRSEPPLPRAARGGCARRGCWSHGRLGGK